MDRYTVMAVVGNVSVRVAREMETLDKVRHEAARSLMNPQVKEIMVFHLGELHSVISRDKWEIMF